MKRLTATLCLTIAVLLGSIGMSWGADFQKGETSFQSGDYATALREWTPLAEQGDPIAQSLLGLIYKNGLGVPQNDKSAVKWYTLAAEQGFPLAQCNLGLRYRRGQGVIQDNIYAHMCWNIVTSSGKSDAPDRVRACDHCPTG